MSFKRKITKILILIIFAGCAKNKIDFSSTVDITDRSLDKQSNILIDKNLMDNIYGPTPNEYPTPNNLVNEKRSTWGMVVLPARSRVFELIKVLKLFETYQLKPNVIIAYEYSSLIAYPFTKKMKVGELEWLLYESFQKKEKNIEAWAIKFRNNLKAKYHGLSLSSSYPLLNVPVWDVVNNVETFADSDDAEKWFSLTTLEIKSYEGKMPSWLKSINLDKIRQHYGLDKLVVIDLFGDKISFKQDDGYLHGVYGTYLSFKKNMIRNKPEIIWMNFFSDSVTQDELPQASEILKKPSDELDALIKRLSKTINGELIN
jgi:hypothetical protein